MKRDTIKKQAPLTYYGGKRRMIQYILPMIPKHKIYVEPYFGGGTVFFAKSPSYLEVINDIDSQLVNFYMQIQTNYDTLKEKIELSLYSEELYKWSKLVYYNKIKASEIDRAYATWLIFNMSINSCPECGWSYNNGTGGSHSGKLLAHKRDSFCPWLKERMRYVQISQRPAIKVIKERDSIDTFFYLDPPYPNTNQGHYAGFTLEDLEELLRVLESIKGKFMLSNYPAEILSEYANKNSWQLTEISINQDIINQMKRRKKKKEVLIQNYYTKQITELNMFQ